MTINGMTTKEASNVIEPEIVISVEQPNFVNTDNFDSLIKQSIRLRWIGIIFMIISLISFLIWFLMIILKLNVISS